MTTRKRKVQALLHTPNVPSPKSSAGEAKKQKNPPKTSKFTKSQVGVGTLCALYAVKKDSYVGSSL